MLDSITGLCYLLDAHWCVCSRGPCNLVVNWKHNTFSVFLHASPLHRSSSVTYSLSPCPPPGPKTPVKLSFTCVSNLRRQKIKARWRSVKRGDECYSPGWWPARGWGWHEGTTRKDEREHMCSGGRAGKTATQMFLIPPQEYSLMSELVKHEDIDVLCFISPSSISCHTLKSYQRSKSFWLFHFNTKWSDLFLSMWEWKEH